MRLTSGGYLTISLLVALGPTGGIAAEKNESAASDKQIAQWVQQLDHDSFHLRDMASRHLLKSGTAAIASLTTAATGDSPEVTERAMRILSQLTSSTDGPTARAAKEALTTLVRSNHPSASARAQEALRDHLQRLIAKIESCGATVATRDGKSYSVDFDAARELGENLRLVHELPEVIDISLSNPLVDDDALAALQGLPKVRQLNLFQSKVSDAGMKYLKTFPSLKRVPMGQTRVTDKGLVHLKDLTQLEYVGLRGNQVTDAGLVHLKGLINLTGLYLGETKVTDVGLAHLKSLTKLNELMLDHTQVSDAGVEHLEALPELRDLYITESRITDKGIARLKKTLPELQLRQR